MSKLEQSLHLMLHHKSIVEGEIWPKWGLQNVTLFLKECVNNCIYFNIKEQGMILHSSILYLL